MPQPLAFTPADKRFSRLVVLRQVRMKNGRTGYLCRCDCGTEVEVRHTALHTGNTKSCGCMNLDRIRERNVARATHGQSHKGGRPTPTFTAWVNMIQRCTNSKHKSYARYGGRGITVCERWLRSFDAFLEDVGEKPAGLELDREKNHLGYEPGNCRWVTRVVNGNNRDVCHAITHDGRTHNIKQWAAELGISHQTIAYRLKAKWSVEDALTTPVAHGNGWKRGTR